MKAEAPACACGCGERIVVRAIHRAKGLPRYTHGHHSSPIRRAHAKLRRDGHVLLGEACQRLGISETTFRWLEAAAVIPRARRVEARSKRGVRVLTEHEIREPKPKIEAWRARR